MIATGGSASMRSIIICAMATDSAKYCNWMKRIHTTATKLYKMNAHVYGAQRE